jgi:hypothetical protein
MSSGPLGQLRKGGSWRFAIKGAGACQNTLAHVEKRLRIVAAPQWWQPLASALGFPKTLFGSAGASAVTFSITGLDSDDTGGAGNTGTVSVVESGPTVTVGVTGDGTYTANLSSGLADGTVATSPTFTDAAGNNFSTAGANVTERAIALTTATPRRPIGAGGGEELGGDQHRPSVGRH